MTETVYDLADDAQVLALGAELVRLGFDASVEADWEDPRSIRGMLSDVDWYSEMWGGRVVEYRRDVGFHPVAGDEDEWDTYMWQQGGTVRLVVA